MNVCGCKKKVIITLIVICVLQLALSVFFGSKKNYLFFDEVFSYPAANCLYEEDAVFAENEWMNEKWFDNFMSADAGHRFDYSIPYENQKRDVHPPLFYFLLHTTSSMIPEQFSYWSGLSVNIVLYLASAVLLYLLVKEIFKSKINGLLLAFLYAVSFGGLNTMVYIRMYMLLTFMTLLHAYVYLKYFEKDKIGMKDGVLLGITLVGGVLSQYYFLFIAFFFGVWYCIRFILKKQYQNLLRYLLTVFVSAGISLLLWPHMLEHLFFGGRGEETKGNLLSFDGYAEGLREMFRIMNNDMFTKLLPVIFVGILLLFVLCLKYKRLNVKQWNSQFFAILFVTMGYFLLVTKAAPYQVDRYVMPIYPLVYLLVAGTCYSLLEKLVPRKLAVILCIMGFGGLSAVHIAVSGIPYTYEKNVDNIERRAIVEEYRDCYALYISDDSSTHFFDAVQMLKEYQGFYYANDLANIAEVKEDMELLSDEKNLIVYVKNKRSQNEANVFIQNVFPECELNEESLLDTDEKWNVYLLEIH